MITKAKFVGGMAVALAAALALPVVAQENKSEEKKSEEKKSEEKKAEPAKAKAEKVAVCGRF